MKNMTTLSIPFISKILLEVYFKMWQKCFIVWWRNKNSFL